MTFLTEHTALYDLDCDGCGGEIEIGDTCFVDHSEGHEEGKAKVYCSECAEEMT